MRVVVPDWSDASCLTANPDLFFAPERERVGGISSKLREDEAKQVCYSCPAVRRCFEYAVDYRMEGVWGASTDDERNRTRRRSHHKKLT